VLLLARLGFTPRRRESEDTYSAWVPMWNTAAVDRLDDRSTPATGGSGSKMVANGAAGDEEIPQPVENKKWARQDLNLRPPDYEFQEGPDQEDTTGTIPNKKGDLD